MMTQPELARSLEHLIALRSETLPLFLLDLADSADAPRCHGLLAEAQRQLAVLEQLLETLGGSDRHAY